MSRGTSFALSRVEMNIAISERRHLWLELLRGPKWALEQPCPPPGTAASRGPRAVCPGGGCGV